ncbi:MAG: hypothetical protein ABEH65_12960 [Halobacteriales archaeon]
MSWWDYGYWMTVQAHLSDLRIRFRKGQGIFGIFPSTK